MSKQFWPSFCFVLMSSIAVFGQTPVPDAATWVAEIGSRYYVVPNLTYLVADNNEAKLDVYVSRSASAAAPAAVEDCRCALRWVIRNAQKYNFDVNKLVVTGELAGSHLALTTGMLPASAGLDGECSGAEELKVAAIINWYGVTDVVDVFEGANQQGFAVRWLSGLPNPQELAQQVLPLQYVRPGLRRF